MAEESLGFGLGDFMAPVIGENLKGASPKVVNMTHYELKNDAKRKFKEIFGKINYSHIQKTTSLQGELKIRKVTEGFVKNDNKEISVTSNKKPKNLMENSKTTHSNHDEQPPTSKISRNTSFRGPDNLQWKLPNGNSTGA